MQAGFGDEKLAFGIDDAQRARHEGQVVHLHGAVRHAFLQKLPAANIEPEQRVGLRIIGRAFAQVASDIGENRYSCHGDYPWPFAKTASHSATAASARPATASTL